MRPLQIYLLGTGSWFLSFGIQSVMFAWLVTIVLHESPEMVGMAQMSMLVPAMLLMLVGGSLADHYGGRLIAVIAQTAALVPPLFLLVVVARNRLSFDAMILYAIVMGVAQAFVTPARDALLNEVAEGSVQRTVVRASLTQFGGQMAGFVIASFADSVGAEPIIGLQALVLGLGIVAFYRVRVARTVPAVGTRPIRNLVRSVREGSRTVFASRLMRIIVLQNCAMGICFMGSYIVTIPLLVREVFDGSAADLAFINVANSLGLMTTIFILMRFGDIQRKGRALLLSQGIGAVALGSVGLSLGFPATLACIYFWGMCGGIAMSMSRTIMQEEAPPAQRGRVMGFFSFSFMGSGPIGALVCGYLVQWLGPETALVVASFAMLVVMLMVTRFSALWEPALVTVD